MGCSIWTFLVSVLAVQFRFDPRRGRPAQWACLQSASERILELDSLLRWRLSSKMASNSRKREQRKQDSLVRCFEVTDPTLHSKGHTIYKVTQKVSGSKWMAFVLGRISLPIIAWFTLEVAFTSLHVRGYSNYSWQLLLPEWQAIKLLLSVDWVESICASILLILFLKVWGGGEGVSRCTPNTSLQSID